MSADITLYGHIRSGNSYKPALMMALTGTPFKFVEVDLVNCRTLLNKLVPSAVAAFSVKW